MGIYLNPGTIEFQESINSEIYVDKTMLIERTNAALRTKQKYMCISRPRRFGKSMAADPGGYRLESKLRTPFCVQAE